MAAVTNTSAWRHWPYMDFTMTFRPTSRQLFSVLAGIHLVGLPLYAHMPLPILVLVMLMTLWSVVIILGKTSQPKGLVRAILLVIVMLVLLASFGSIFGRDPGTAFLLMLSFLKLFEMKSKRDIVIVVFIGYFLIASNFFFTQSPWIAAYVFLIVTYLTSLLIILSDRLNSTGLRQRLQTAGQMIGYALPLMLILFVLFPRIPGPLWGLPKDASAGLTGLSEKMSPGSISQLIQSDDVAFRVRFADGRLPPKKDRYWRGLVLSKYDGVTWIPNELKMKERPPLQSFAETQDRYDYTVTLEPHNHKWLLALEYPIEADDEYQYTQELQLLSKHHIINVRKYRLVSDIGAQNIGYHAWRRDHYLQLPTGLNPQTVELATQWRQAAGVDDRQVVDAAYRHFREEEFHYTTVPELLGRHAMDDFLFRTREGFCEHYASAFVYLMRAAGIPARVVLGYQGGIMNPLSDYMIVYQRDAHAWAEVWLEESGWTRIDPTAAVSPDRIDSGLEGAVPQLDVFSENETLSRARYLWDTLNDQWNEWVVGFDHRKQLQLFRQLGLQDTDWADLALWLIIAMLMAGAVTSWWMLRRRKPGKHDLAQYYYERFCYKLARYGLKRRTSEGPQAFLQRICQQQPAVAGVAGDITADYLAIRYGGDRSERRLKALIAGVRRLRINNRLS